VAREEVCPQVALQGSFHSYLRAIPKKERHEIRRKARNLEQLLPQAQLRVVTQRDEALALLPDFFRLHRLSAPDKERFLTPVVEEFFARIVGATADGGWLRLYVLSDGEVPVAMMLAFLADNQLLVYNSGFDPSHRQLSVGMTLTGMMIEHAANDGVAICDFLRGNESYKYRFGAHDVPIWRVLAGNDGPALDRAMAEMLAALETPADARDRTEEDETMTEDEA
jgi:CelD/BcsL family acetyltransferase involved in cellulose biosynthesis